MIRFDFEARSKVDLKKVGPWVYSQHPSTEILVMCYSHDKGEVQTFVPNMFNIWDPPEMWKRAVGSPRETFEAHNAFFEWCIYHNVLVKRFKWPPISPDRWRCTMSVSCSLALPRSLDDVGQALGLSTTKDKEGHRVMLKLSKPRKPSKNNPARYHAKPEDFQKLYSYCATDVKAQRAISETVGELPKDELLIWQIDQLINRRGVYCDVETVQGAIHILDQCLGQFNHQIEQLTGGVVKTTGQRDKIISWCATQGVQLENLQAKTVSDVLENGMMQYVPELDSFVPAVLPPRVKEVLSTRQSASKSSVKKYAAMLDRVDLNDNRIRSILLYHGASTGRWSGSGIQIQNYPRGTFKFWSKKTPSAPLLEDVITLVKHRDYDGLKELGDVPEILSSLLRSMLCAPPGKKFLAADYSSIEARALLWLVGDDYGLNVFRMNGDIYVDMAHIIYGVPHSEITKDQRFVGKQCILGLGYGMGWKKFMKQCESFGRPVSEALAKKAVTTYRKKYKKVVDYWESVNSAAILAVQSGQPVQCGRVTFFMEGDFLKCRLPSGRDLSYYKPHFVPHKFKQNELALAYMGMDSQKHKWTSISTYGGMLAENITQAIAGDLLRVATVALESNGFPLVLSVHDELVCEVPDDPWYTIDRMGQLMCTLPPWGLDIPVAVEGWEGYRFKK